MVLEQRRPKWLVDLEWLFWNRVPKVPTAVCRPLERLNWAQIA
jgi:hypothetical protein